MAAATTNRQFVLPIKSCFGKPSGPIASPRRAERIGAAMNIFPLEISSFFGKTSSTVDPMPTTFPVPKPRLSVRVGATDHGDLGGLFTPLIGHADGD